MAANPIARPKELNAKQKAWIIFDRIVSLAKVQGAHSNPWVASSNGELYFEPDYKTLEVLLGVPLYLKAATNTGVPAMALDVWLSYELRRAGFDTDQVWPRPVPPRILPASIVALLKALPNKARKELEDRIRHASIPGVTSSSASILGKNYVKQVDVIITDYDTGPELLISTKRMDSSYGNNAANRVEESYGDAKNLRLRHPLAALGFVLGLRSDILELNPNKAEWMFDLLTKLGREDDAYHATCLVLMKYENAPPAEITEGGDKTAGIDITQPGLQSDNDEMPLIDMPNAVVDRYIAQLPKVTILKNQTPEALAPGRFLTTMVAGVLSTTPINMHKEVRERRKAACIRLMPGHSE